MIDSPANLFYTNRHNVNVRSKFEAPSVASVKTRWKNRSNKYGATRVEILAQSWWLYTVSDLVIEVPVTMEGFSFSFEFTYYLKKLFERQI